MESDPIIDEIHQIRAEMLAKFNGDLHALVEDARRRQFKSGHRIVTIEDGVEVEVLPDAQGVKKAG